MFYKRYNFLTWEYLNPKWQKGSSFLPEFCRSPTCKLLRVFVILQAQLRVQYQSLCKRSLPTIIRLRSSTVGKRLVAFPELYKLLRIVQSCTGHLLIQGAKCRFALEDCSSQACLHRDFKMPRDCGQKGSLINSIMLSRYHTENWKLLNSISYRVARFLSGNQIHP